MDRRGFLKSLFSVPLITPLITGSKLNVSGGELYLLSDAPHEYLPSILEELRKLGLVSGNSFSLSHPHPRQDDLIQFLTLNHWSFIPDADSSDIMLSYRRLHNSSRASFTLIRDGRIRDIRTQKLYQAWKTMGLADSPSSSLTIVSLKRKPVSVSPGSSVQISQDGRTKEILSLSRDAERTYTTGKGKIRVVISGGKVRVAESSCGQKVCVHNPPIRISGERIICAPNHFLLEIKGFRFIDTVTG